MDSRVLKAFFSSSKYTETKVPERTLDVVFEKDSKTIDNQNGQEKCKDIKFPSSRSLVKHVGIRSSSTLLEAKHNSLHLKDIREITLDGTELMEFDWQPGDTIAVLPSNSSESVAELLKLLNLESKADVICSVEMLTSCSKKNVKIPSYIPCPTTPREILRDCLNLKSHLSKKFLRSLAEYCADENEKKFLKYLSSKEGSTHYNNLVIKRATCIDDILTLCVSCKPPFSLIIENLPRLLPRPYSITNSPLKSKDEITLIYSSFKYSPGLTTGMLIKKSFQKSALSIYLRSSTIFRYTEENYEENQVLIAIGTGVAPFLGFLQHKEELINKGKQKPGETWLFLGTPSRASVVHREELLKWHSNNVIHSYYQCYSRGQTDDYHCVQEAMLKNSEKLVSFLLESKTKLYICADGGPILRSIEKTVQAILAKHLSIKWPVAANWVKAFKNKNKYMEDNWQ